MNNTFKKKWITVFTIWCGVILMSIFIFFEVENIKLKRVENEVINMDRFFLKTHAEKIDWIFDEEARLYHSIRSVGIGKLVVENQLRQMGKAHKLNDIRLENKSNNNDHENLTLSFFACGTIPDMISLLGGLKKEAPYLTPIQIEWSDVLGSEKAQFNLILSYRYHLADTEKDA